MQVQSVFTDLSHGEAKVTVPLFDGIGNHVLSLQLHSRTGHSGMPGLGPDGIHRLATRPRAAPQAARAPKIEPQKRAAAREFAGAVFSM